MDENSINNFQKTLPKCNKIVRINQVLWDWRTMLGKEYDGGLFNGNEKE
jgi:hypothetical protein